jgi:hypothetical protein
LNLKQGVLSEIPRIRRDILPKRAEKWFFVGAETKREKSEG